MEDKITKLIQQITHIAEQYGAIAATSGDKSRLRKLEDEYSMILNEVRRVLAPAQRPAWGVGTLAAQRQAQTAAGVKMAQQQAQFDVQKAQQQMYQHLFGGPMPGLEPLEPEEPQEPIEIEFSL